MRLVRLAALTFVPFLLAGQRPAPSLPGVRQELLDNFRSVSNRALTLAKAVPEDKYAWRPMEGVRSMGEVFVHMAGSTLLFCSYGGLKPPQGPAQDLAAVYMKRGFELPEIFAVEAKIKSKAKVLEIMEQAFRQPVEMLTNMKDNELDKNVQFFNRTLTLRGVMILMDEHLGEHLGQSIAYARVNHIVPPWSQKGQ